MLTYHPIHDHSHCAFRILCLSRDIDPEGVHWDLLKLLDFYLLFPHELNGISLPRSLIKFKSTFKKIPEPYENLPNAKRLFFSLGEIQNNTINFMLSKGICVHEAFQEGNIKIRIEAIPKKISELYETASFRNEPWYEFITGDLPTVGFDGVNGLKKRSGLLEFRYDVA